MSTRIHIERTRTPKAPPPSEGLGFGKHFSDHMLVVDYAEGQGWGEPRIIPYGPLALDPAAAALHYGQTLFEGMKAFHRDGGAPVLFRPDRHVARLNASARRLCMPELPEALAMACVEALVDVDREFVPRGPGTSLYLRPLMIATEGFLGVRPSRRYSFVVISSPVGLYFSAGSTGVRIWVETEHVRAARGGIGAAKAGGNYAASLLAAERAKARGYDQVLWLDERHEQIEEVGTMNVVFRIGDTLVTPALHDSILAGVTRDSVLALAREAGMKVEERALSLEEVRQAHRAGQLREAFGTGTAAVISPIKELATATETLTLPESPGPFALQLREAILAIQEGRAPDTHGWMHPVTAAAGSRTAVG